MKSEIKTVTIGFIREDGDIQVLATLNNNDELLSEKECKELIDRTWLYFDEVLDENIIVFWRQDTPDYVTPCVPPEDLA